MVFENLVVVPFLFEIENQQKNTMSKCDSHARKVLVAWLDSRSTLGPEGQISNEKYLQY